MLWQNWSNLSSQLTGVSAARGDCWGEMIWFPGDERKPWVSGSVGAMEWSEVMWPRQCCHVKSQFISITPPPTCLFEKHTPNSSSPDHGLTSSCLLTFYWAFTYLWGFQTEDLGDRQRTLARSHWITAVTNDSHCISPADGIILTLCWCWKRSRNRFWANYYSFSQS